MLAGAATIFCPLGQLLATAVIADTGDVSGHPWVDMPDTVSRLNSLGGKMSSTVRLLGLFAGLCIAMPAMAGESAAVKCAGSQDRVWLYDSLVSFEVQAKLKCGETVEILSREKGFAKIRTQSGAEGYVPETALPKPVTADAHEEKPVAQLSLAEQARAARAARTASASAPATSSHAAQATAASIPNNDKSGESKIAVAQDRPSESLQPVAASSKSSDVASISATTVETSTSASNKPAAGQPPANNTAHSATGSTDASASRTSNQKNEKAAGKAKTTQPVPARPARPAAVPPSTTSSASNLAPAAPDNGKRSATVASNSASATPRTVTAVETKSATLRSEPIATTRTVAATTEPESEDYPERLIEDESANPACGTYFSAYGLSPMQYKWIVDNRQKKYPAICPASAPGKVDFVVILTHDVGFYNSTMPNPVHIDRNGFSDWNPMTRADDTVVSAYALDKSKHEYVWVFQMKRGAFDPAKFSPRRRPQFTKVESNGLGSHAAPRSMDDAFQFMQTAPAR